MLAAAAKLVVFVALLSIPGLSFRANETPSAPAFFGRALLWSGLLAWISLIVAYVAPITRPLGFFTLCAWLVIAWRRLGREGLLAQLRPAAEVLAVQIFACLLVYGAGYLYGGFEHPLLAASKRWFHWEGDNELPYIAFQRLTTHDLSRMPGDWQLSDRPPLQAAFVTLLAPLARSQGNYELIGIALQSFALTGLYLLLRALSIGSRAALATVALVASAGFFLMNGFYVWPKLLSAGYLCAAAAALFSRNGRGAAWTAGALAALGLLAHGGALFGILAILLVALCGPSRARLMSMIAALLVTVLPWLAFTHYVDPPGNRLAKWHLAGVVKPDSRGFAETLLASYRSQSPEQIVRNKVENARIQLGEASYFSHALQFGNKSWWDEQFGVLAFACFPAWLGFVALLFRSSWSLLGRCLRLHALWIITLGFTCALMFGPALDVDWTVATARPSIPQQTYFIALLALAGALGALLSLPGPLRAILIGAQLLFATLPYFFRPVDVAIPIFVSAPLRSALLISVLALIGLAYFFLRPLRDERVAATAAFPLEPPSA